LPPTGPLCVTAQVSETTVGTLPATLGVTVKVPVEPSSTEGSPVQVPPMTVGDTTQARAKTAVTFLLADPMFTWHSLPLTAVQSPAGSHRLKMLPAPATAVR